MAAKEMRVLDEAEIVGIKQMKEFSEMELAETIKFPKISVSSKKGR